MNNPEHGEGGESKREQKMRDVPFREATIHRVESEGNSWQVYDDENNPDLFRWVSKTYGVTPKVGDTIKCYGTSDRLRGIDIGDHEVFYLTPEEAALEKDVVEKVGADYFDWERWRADHKSTRAEPAGE